MKFIGCVLRTKKKKKTKNDHQSELKKQCCDPIGPAVDILSWLINKVPRRLCYSSCRCRTIFQLLCHILRIFIRAKIQPRSQGFSLEVGRGGRTHLQGKRGWSSSFKIQTKRATRVFILMWCKKCQKNISWEFFSSIASFVWKQVHFEP